MTRVFCPLMECNWRFAHDSKDAAVSAERKHYADNHQPSLQPPAPSTSEDEL